MKAIFGILSLLIVLAVVGSIAKKQMQAIGADASASRNAAAASQSGAFSAGARNAVTLPAAAGVRGAIVADPNGASVPQLARDTQERARANTVHALEQGAQRNQRADP